MNKKSFTLIEAIVVVAIIAILAAIVVPVVRGFIDRAILQEGVAGMAAILIAEKQYHARHGSYVGLPWVWSYPNCPLDITPDDLKGKYWDWQAYFPPLIDWSGQPIIIRFSPRNSVDESISDRFADAGFLYMTEDGSIYSNNPEITGYPHPTW